MENVDIFSFMTVILPFLGHIFTNIGNGWPAIIVLVSKFLPISSVGFFIEQPKQV